MWLSHPINLSKYKVVRRFDLLVAIAKAMRGCHFYYVNAQDHILYGVPEEMFIIRSVKLPPEMVVTSSFLFRTDTVDIDVVNNYIDFIILDDIPWAGIPLVNVGDLYGYEPRWHPESELKLWTVMKGNTEVDYVDLLAPQTAKSAMIPQVREYINGYLSTRQFADQPIIFPHMERDLTIQKIFQSKVSIGEQFLQLYCDNKSYGIMMFRTMFPLNKSDKLNIYANDRIDNPDIFEIHYEVIHTNNPIGFVIDGHFVEYTHTAAVRVNKAGT